MTASIHEAIMQDWNWSYGYGIAKDVANGKDVFVHHENCLEACKFNIDGTPRVATGFEWLDGVGTVHTGPIGEGKIWFERRDKIYYTTDPAYPNVAFNVSIYPHTNTIVDMDEELDATQQQRRLNYATDDVNGRRVKEVNTPVNTPVTPDNKKPRKKRANSPHVRELPLTPNTT